EIESRDTEDGDIVVDVEHDHVRLGREQATGKADARVLLPGDDVGRGHDEIPPRDPAAPLDPAAAGRAEDLDDAGGGGADRRIAEDTLAGRQRRGPGADDRRKRIDAVEQVEQRPRRQGGVELLDDLRALDLPTKPGLAGREQSDRRTDPDDRDADRAAEEETAGRI